KAVGIKENDAADIVVSQFGSLRSGFYGLSAAQILGCLENERPPKRPLFVSETTCKCHRHSHSPRAETTRANRRTSPRSPVRRRKPRRNILAWRSPGRWSMHFQRRELLPARNAGLRAETGDTALPCTKAGRRRPRLPQVRAGRSREARIRFAA